MSNLHPIFERILEDAAHPAMQDLGVANNWASTPQVVIDCLRKIHAREQRYEGDCLRVISCRKCGYMYRVDSSD